MIAQTAVVNADTSLPTSSGTAKYAQKMIISSGMPRTRRDHTPAMRRSQRHGLTCASPISTAIGNDITKPSTESTSVTATPPSGPFGHDPTRNNAR